jgi:Mrp family chromosome partitioning ATPase
MTAASDAEGMAALADACLLVVRQNAADASSVNRSIAALESSRAKLLGCVLNNVVTTNLTSGRNSRYGRYGHYGHYGSYGSGK